MPTSVASLFGQGIVLADTKTARPSPRIVVSSSAVVGALNAFGLFAHTNEIRARQASNAAYALAVGSLRHFIGVRVGDEHLAHLQALEEASGLSRGEILRRLLLTAGIPSARTSQEVQDILRMRNGQDRVGGSLAVPLHGSVHG